MRQNFFFILLAALFFLFFFSPLLWRGGGGEAFSQRAKVVSAYNYLQYNEPVKAKEAIDVAITNEDTKEWHKTWYYRGLIYQSFYTDTGQRKKFPDALEQAKVSYMKAIELDKKKEFSEDASQKLKAITGAIYTEGVNFYSQQNFASAYQNFASVLTVNEFFGTMDTGAILNAAFSGEKAEKWNEAKMLYKKLMDFQYKNPAVYQSLAMIYKKEKDTANSLLTIEQGRKIFPENKSLIIDELNIYLASGKITQAIDKLNEAIKLDAGNADLYFALGTAYDNLKEREKAKQIYEKALELKPNYFEVLYNLGALFYNMAIEVNERMNNIPTAEQKKYDEMKLKRDKYFSDALPYFEKALLTNPADLNVLNALKEIYLRIGNETKSGEIKKKIEEIKSK